MANATWDEVWDMITTAVKIRRETFKFASQNSNNLVGMQTTLKTQLRGDFTQPLETAVAGLRNNLATMLASDKDLWMPCLYELRKIIKSANTPGTLDFHRDLVAYMVANSKTVTRRNFTRGAIWAYGSNVGTGTVLTLTTDEYNQAIEAGGAYTTTFKCIKDNSTGGTTGSGAALFTVFVSGAKPTDLCVSGAGAGFGAIQKQSRPAEDGVLTNPSFKDYNSSATHKFTGWFTSGAYTNVTQYTTSGARIDRGTRTTQDPTGTYSTLKFTGSALSGAAFYQFLPRDLDQNVPYCGYIWVRTEGAGGATIYLRVGDQETSMMASGAAGAWTRLVFGGATGSNKNWFRQFKSGGTPTKFEFYVRGLSAGSVLFDCAFFGKYDYFNGRHFVIVPGRTDFQADNDFFSCVDTDANSLGIQASYERAFPGWFLPMAAATSESEPDPT